MNARLLIICMILSSSIFSLVKVQEEKVRNTMFYL